MNTQQFSRLNVLEDARKKYHEAEWRLQFLRTIPALPLPQPTDEELLKWYTQLN